MAESRCVIYGGGESRRSDFLKVGDYDFLIAANHHTFEDGITPDVIAHLDPLDQPRNERLKRAIETTKAFTVSEKNIPADVNVEHRKYNIFDSGQLAIWYTLTYIPNSYLYLCGLDLREGQPTHDMWYGKWMKFLSTLGEKTNKLKPMSGPLHEMINTIMDPDVWVEPEVT